MSTADCDLISVIIPCYNGEEFLSAAIESVLAQSYPCVEIIVVDDGSTDGSSAVMDSYSKKITIIHQDNAGLPAARNAGVAVATGSFLAFLDCDDYWDANFLTEMHAAIEAASAAIAYCGWKNEGLSGPRGKPFIPPDYEVDPEKIEKLVGGVRWPVHAALIRRPVFDEVGGFDPKLKSCEDFGFWIRAATSRKLVCQPKVLAFYRHHGEQMTSNRKRMIKYHFRVQREFLKERPDIIDKLGRKKVRQLIYGELLRKGYECYWARDLDAARMVFQSVLLVGYFGFKDLKYLLPALLPIAIHKKLVSLTSSDN